MIARAIARLKNKNNVPSPLEAYLARLPSYTVGKKDIVRAALSGQFKVTGQMYSAVREQKQKDKIEKRHLKKGRTRKRSAALRSAWSLLTANPYKYDEKYGQFLSLIDAGRLYSRAKAHSVECVNKAGKKYETLIILSPQAAYLVARSKVRKNDTYEDGYAIVKSRDPEQLQKKLVNHDSDETIIFSQDEVDSLFSPVAGFYEDDVTTTDPKTNERYLVASRFREVIEQDILDSGRFLRKHGASFKESSSIYRSASGVLWVEKNDKAPAGYKFHYYANPEWGETMMFMNEEALNSRFLKTKFLKPFDGFKLFQGFFKTISVNFKPPAQADGKVARMTPEEAELFARETLCKCSKEAIRYVSPYKLKLPKEEAIKDFFERKSFTRHLEKATVYLANKIKNPSLRKRIERNGLHDTTVSVATAVSFKTINIAHTVSHLPLSAAKLILHAISNIEPASIFLTLGIGSGAIAASAAGADADAVAAGGLGRNIMPKITRLLNKTFKGIIPKKQRKSIDKASNVVHELTCKPATNSFVPDGTNLSMNARLIPDTVPVDRTFMPYFYNEDEAGIPPLTANSLELWAERRLINTYAFQPGTIFDIDLQNPLSIGCLEPNGIRVVRNTEEGNAYVYRAAESVNGSVEEKPVRLLLDKSAQAGHDYTLVRAKHKGGLEHVSFPSLDKDFDLMMASKIKPIPPKNVVIEKNSDPCSVKIDCRHPFHLEADDKSCRGVVKRAHKEFKKYIKAATKGKILDADEERVRAVYDNMRTIYGDTQCCKSYFKRVAKRASNDAHTQTYIAPVKAMTPSRRFQIV